MIDEAFDATARRYPRRSGQDRDQSELFARWLPIVQRRNRIGCLYALALLLVYRTIGVSFDSPVKMFLALSGLLGVVVLTCISFVYPVTGGRKLRAIAFAPVYPHTLAKVLNRQFIQFYVMPNGVFLYLCFMLLGFNPEPDILIAVFVFFFSVTAAGFLICDLAIAMSIESTFAETVLKVFTGLLCMILPPGCFGVAIAYFWDSASFWQHPWMLLGLWLLMVCGALAAFFIHIRVKRFCRKRLLARFTYYDEGQRYYRIKMHVTRADAGWYERFRARIRNRNKEVSAAKSAERTATDDRGCRIRRK